MLMLRQAQLVILKGCAKSSENEQVVAQLTSAASGRLLAGLQLGRASAPVVAYAKA